MYLSVIIPAHNGEKRNIRKTIELVFVYLEKQGFPYEIIVVSNSSTDRTAAIVQELMPQMPTLKLLDYPDRKGKGFAVREGMLHATGDYRLFMDDDNSTTIENIENMMPYFTQGYNVVIGSIRAPGHKVVGGSEPWYRLFLGRLSSWYSQIILLPGIMDTQRGFKIFSSKAAQDVFSRSRINQFGFDMEVLALARKFGYKIKEAPITWKNDAVHSSVKLRDYIQVLLDTLRIKRDLMTGKYTRPEHMPNAVKPLT
jgi:dolichyl-phosphate beta-glucosyltransferase